ncbi:unnamed protein product, partial [Oikopleura dioica]
MKSTLIFYICAFSGWKTNAKITTDIIRPQLPPGWWENKLQKKILSGYEKNIAPFSHQMMEDGIESPIVVNFAMVLQRLLTIKMREEEIVMAGYNVVDQAYKFSKRNSQKRQSEAKRSDAPIYRLFTNILKIYTIFLLLLLITTSPMDYKAPWEHEPPSNVSDILECQLSPQKHETNKQNPLKRFKESLRRIGRKRVLKNANLAINETISLLNSTSKTWDETLTDESQNKAQYITQRAKKLKLNRSANETKRTPNEVKNAPKKRKKGQQKRIDKNCPALNLSTFTEKNTLVFKTNNLFNQQISDVDPTPVNQHQRKGQKCRKELLFTGDMSDRRKSGGSMGFNFNLKTPNQSLGNSTYGNNSFPNNSFNRPNGQQQHSNGHHQQMHAPNNWNGQQQRPGTARTNGARQQPYGKKPPRNASELQISNAIGGFVRGNRQEDQGFCESPNQHPHNYAQQSQHNVVLTAAPDVRYQRRGAIHMVAGDA